MLCNRGNAISGASNISATSQFPNPPIITGITIKKNINDSIRILIDVPIILDQNPKIKDNDPMSLK